MSTTKSIDQIVPEAGVDLSRDFNRFMQVSPEWAQDRLEKFVERIRPLIVKEAVEGLKRYDICPCPGSEYNCSASMEATVEGEFVRYSDLETLTNPPTS